MWLRKTAVVCVEVEKSGDGDGSKERLLALHKTFSPNYAGVLRIFLDQLRVTEDGDTKYVKLRGQDESDKFKPSTSMNRTSSRRVASMNRYQHETRRFSRRDATSSPFSELGSQYRRD